MTGVQSLSQETFPYGIN